MRAVRKTKSSFRMRNVGFIALLEKCDTTGQMKDQITYQITHAVKMVDSCLRENGVLCTVARSWLLLLHDEGEWKNVDTNIS